MIRSRIERRLVATLVAVAVVPLVAAMLLGRDALREAYAVGVNPEVQRQLEAAVEQYRERIAALRRGTEALAIALAADHGLVTAAAREDVAAAGARLTELLETHAELHALQLLDARGRRLVERTRTADPDDEPSRLLEREAPLPSSTWTLRVGTRVPLELLEAHRRAGDVRETYALLEAGADDVAVGFALTFLALLAVVAGVSGAVGIWLARRTTRRIELLVAATARVGRGELDVRVPSDADDELGELTRAFNAMVRDLRESRERIEYLQRISAWQELARRLAHEIKNPLTPIQLAVQDAHESYRGDDAALRARLAETRAIVEEEVATLRRLVSEFSAFARLPEVRLEPADLVAWLAEARRSLGAEWEGDPALELDWRLPQQPLPVAIDGMMLRRALDNLVRNAVQAVRSTRARGRVVVEARRENGHAVLEVRDDGPGVPEPMRERVFDPYFTTRPDGTGLGLAIVKKLVLEHGGEIRCGQAPEGGACFTVRLPLRSPS
ncbi:MAG: ATP-binding protein [Myxococcota bacterium]|nr:ATP-binding protein [Myxococcota bacterium]MDW8362075.1 ATP-binding protein [Myxococcales bacterium]